MKNKLTIIIGIILMLNISIVFGLGNNYVTNFYDAKTNQVVTGVTNIYYQCNQQDCADITEPLKFSTLNSGATNTLNQEFLGSINPTDYLEVSLAQCYLPYGVVDYDDFGAGYLIAPYNVKFTKAENCHSPIYSYNVTNNAHANEPITINVEAKLDATTSSAFKKTGFAPLFTPVGYETYFGAETQITLYIYDSNDNIINTQTQTVNLIADTTRQISFSWTPTIAGDYFAGIQTDVIDCQCDSNITEFVAKAFTVLQARPLNQCYTLLNNLQSNIIFPFVNDNIQLSVNQITNHANNNGVLTPVPTTLEFEILNYDTGEIVYTTTTNTIASSSNSIPVTSSINWVPIEAGQYVVLVSGTPNSNLCNGLQLISETTQMSIIVSNPPAVCTDIDRDGFSQEGNTCGVRDCVDSSANIHPGAIETCNGLDDNCDGVIDNGLAIMCSNNNQCNDNNPVTTDVCSNAGTCSASCSHNVCNVACSNNNQCNDNNPVTTDVCSNAGTCSASCTHNTCNVACSNNNQCNDNNPVTTDVCNNAGTCAATCNYNITPVQCTPGQTQTQSCGTSNIGVCRLGNQTRTCQIDGTFGQFGACTGAINPTTEICNNLDDNCDGIIDNGCVNHDMTFTISATPTSGRAPLQVFFETTIQTGDAPFTYSWNFGDGYFSTEKNPVHIFYDEKIYTSTLRVTDADGSTASASITINTKDTESGVLESKDAIYVGDVTPLNEVLKVGEDLMLSISFENRAKKILKDTSVTISIPELGISKNVKTGKLSNKDSVTKTVVLELPKNVRPGHYFIRTTFYAQSGEVIRTIYREIVIKDNIQNNCN